MLEAIAAIVREAGDVILSAGDIAAKTHEKTSAADLVTDYDVAVETLLREKLLALLPEAVFYGEEEETAPDPTRGWAFLVDPIDGTTNFVRGICQSAISVGVTLDGVLQYGVVYDPAKGELFSAGRGGGAFLNGVPIHVSDKPLSQGIFLVGTALYHRKYLEPTISLTRQLWERSCDFRRLGSAALDMCYVACGRAEVFFEYSLSPWDYAAGAMILEEAGGCSCTLEGEPLHLGGRGSVWASNPASRDVRKELTI